MIRVPAGLRWLVMPDPRPERATPRPVLTEEVTDEDIAEFMSVWREAMGDIADAINHVQLRQFIDTLPAVHHRPTTWPMPAPTPRDVIERAFPKSYRKEGR